MSYFFKQGNTWKMSSLVTNLIILSKKNAAILFPILFIPLDSHFLPFSVLMIQFLVKMKNQKPEDTRPSVE